MNEKEIIEALKYLSNKKYMKILKKVETIFRHIIMEKNIQKYNNNEEMKEILYKMYKEMTNSEMINYKKLDKIDINSNIEIIIEKCVVELVSILIQISDNYNIKDDFYDNLLIFLKNRNNNLKQVLNYFFAFIFKFTEIIRMKHNNNPFIKFENDKYAIEFYSSKDFKKFFLLYINYDEENCLRAIKNDINTNFFKYLEPYYFRLIFLQNELKNKSIIMEIIKLIFDNILIYDIENIHKNYRIYYI